MPDCLDTIPEAEVRNMLKFMLSASRPEKQWQAQKIKNIWKNWSKNYVQRNYLLAAYFAVISYFLLI